MTVEIEFVPADKPGTYWPVRDGVKLTKATKQPFFDAGRALLKAGLDADAPLLGRHAGSQTIALQSTIGEAARWSVSEPDRGKTKRIPYVAYSPTTDAERGFVGAVYGPAGPWVPTDPTIEAGDPA